MQKTTMATLTEFINAAEKSRKYPKNTALGLKAALNLFESEANDDEKQSLQTFIGNFEQIYTAVVNNSNNKQKFTTGSLATYRLRLKRLLSDYEKYGVDATKMSGWNPIIRTRGPRKVNNTQIGNSPNSTSEAINEGVNTEGSHKIELVLSDNKKALIIVPAGLSPQEAERIKGILDAFVVQ